MFGPYPYPYGDSKYSENEAKTQGFAAAFKKLADGKLAYLLDRESEVHEFTVAELDRLKMFRQAVKDGFYNDGDGERVLVDFNVLFTSATDEQTGDSAVLSTVLSGSQSNGVGAQDEQPRQVSYPDDDNLM